MSVTLGKIFLDKGEVGDLAFKQGSLRDTVIHRNDATLFTNYDGGLTQSLDDLFIVKLMEVVFKEVELENHDADTFFIPCTAEQPFWVQIVRTSSSFEIEIGEPAA